MSSGAVGPASRVRRALWLLAPPALFAVVMLRTTELSSLEAVLSSAEPLWLVAAALLAGVFALNQGALYRGVFAVLGEDVALGDAVVLSLVMAFASLALPAGTASGIAYFVSAARDRGIAASRALLAGLAYYLFDYGALMPVLLTGMAVLRMHHDLGRAALAALGIFYVTALLGAGLVGWGLLRPDAVKERVTRAAGSIDRRLGRIAGRLPGTAARFAGEIQEILTLVRRRPIRSLRPLVHAVLLQGIAIGLLDAVFAALGFPVAPAPLIAGYAVGTVFMVVSITPAGVGVVEGAMTVTFTSLGVPLEVAAAATVLFRLYTFWLPMLAGFFTLRLLPPAAA